MNRGFIVDQVARIRAGRWLARTMNAVALLVVVALDWLGQGACTPLYSLPVALSALADGWRGGLAMAILSSIAIITRAGSANLASSAVGSIALVCLSLLVGFIFDRERRQRSHFQEMTAKLSSVYEKVQANFAGMNRVETLSALGQLSA